MMRVLVLALLAATASAGEPYPSGSVYQLKAMLTDQDGKSQGLDLYSGHPVLVAMFYGSCQATCPLIIDKLRSLEKATPDAERANLRVLLISFDPKRDSAPALRAIATSRRIDTSRWTLARTDDASVRRIAALLDVQYRALPSGEFNHSAKIIRLSPAGEVQSSTGL